MVLPLGVWSALHGGEHAWRRLYDVTEGRDITSPVGRCPCERVDVPRAPSDAARSCPPGAPCRRRTDTHPSRAARSQCPLLTVSATGARPHAPSHSHERLVRVRGRRVVLWALPFTVTAYYFVTEVGMSPLELVLVGTVSSPCSSSRCRRGSSPTRLAAALDRDQERRHECCVRGGRRVRGSGRSWRPTPSGASAGRLHERRDGRVARGRGGRRAPDGRVPPRRAGRTLVHRARDRRGIGLALVDIGSRSCSAESERSPSPCSMRAGCPGLALAPAARGRGVGAHGAHRARGRGSCARDPLSRSSASPPSWACGRVLRPALASARTSAAVDRRSSTRSSGSASSALSDASLDRRRRAPGPAATRLAGDRGQALGWLYASLAVSSFVFALAGSLWLAVLGSYRIFVAARWPAALHRVAEPERRRLDRPASSLTSTRRTRPGSDGRPRISTLGTVTSIRVALVAAHRRPAALGFLRVAIRRTGRNASLPLRRSRVIVSRMFFEATGPRAGRPPPGLFSFRERMMAGRNRRRPLDDGGSRLPTSSVASRKPC